MFLFPHSHFDPVFRGEKPTFGPMARKYYFYFGGKKWSFFAPKAVCQKWFFITREEISKRPRISEVFLFYPENDGQKKKSHRFQGTEKKHKK
jgi:hypothetical protein